MEDATTNSQALLEGVADGTIDYTIADSTEFAFAHDEHPDLRIAFDFPGSQSLAWAASDRYPEFVQAYERLFRESAPKRRTGRDRESLLRAFRGCRVRGGAGLHAPPANRLPLYKKWFEEAADESSQDWRLLAAIGYQESKWNPHAASASGALGLMQLTMQSATAVKVANPADPRQSIFGGARYFRQCLREDSRARARARSHLVRARRLQHRLWSCRRRAGARAASRPRSGFLG